MLRHLPCGRQDPSPIGGIRIVCSQVRAASRREDRKDTLNQGAIMPQANSTRRDFLKTGATAAGGIVAASMGLESCVHAAGNDLFRIGLIGCGGRGTGAAAQALKADPN